MQETQRHKLDRGSGDLRQQSNASLGVHNTYFPDLFERQKTQQMNWNCDSNDTATMGIS